MGGYSGGQIPRIRTWPYPIVFNEQGNHASSFCLMMMQIAYKHGIKTFVATIHPTNYRVLRWMDEIGAIPVHTEDG